MHLSSIHRYEEDSSRGSQSAQRVLHREPNVPGDQRRFDCGQHDTGCREQNLPERTKQGEPLEYYPFSIQQSEIILGTPAPRSGSPPVEERRRNSNQSRLSDPPTSPQVRRSNDSSAEVAYREPKRRRATGSVVESTARRWQEEQKQETITLS